MEDALGAASGGLIASFVIQMLVSVGIYVWVSLALMAVFRKAGITPWKGWVPVLREWELLKLARMNPMWAIFWYAGPILYSIIVSIMSFALVGSLASGLSSGSTSSSSGLAGFGIGLFLVSLLYLAFAVVLIIIIVKMVHRITTGFGFGTGFTVLGVLLFPIWASILGWGDARWQGSVAAARPGPAPQQGPPAFAPNSALNAPAAPRYAPPVTPPPPPAPPAPRPQAAPPARPAPVAQQPAPQAPSFAPQPPRPPAPPQQVAPAPQSAPAQLAAPAQPAPQAPVQPSVAVPPTAPVQVQPAAGQPASAPHDPWAPPAPPAPAAAGPATPARSTDMTGSSEIVGGPGPRSASNHAARDAGDFVPQAIPEPQDTVLSASNAAAAADASDLDDATVLASRSRTLGELTLPGGETVTLTNNVVFIGRNPERPAGEEDAQLVTVPDGTRTISKTHAKLTRSGNDWTITDLGSTNGIVFLDESGTEIEVTEPTTVSGKFLLGDAELMLRDGK